MIVPMLAMAGSLAAKKRVPCVALIAGVVLIVGGLSFFPALALAPSSSTSR